MVMGGRTLPNLALKGFYDIGDNSWGSDMSLNLLKLSILTQGGVISRIGALPGAPADGDVYILTTDKKVHVRDAGAWVEFTPHEGWLLYDRDADKYVTYDGAAWNELATGGGGGGGGGIEEAPIDGTPYSRQDGAWVEAAAAGGGDESYVDFASVVFSSDGTIISSHNVSSVDHTGSGRYLVHFTVPAEDADKLLPSGAAWFGPYANNDVCYVGINRDPAWLGGEGVTTDAVSIQVKHQNGGDNDPVRVSLRIGEVGKQIAGGGGGSGGKGYSDIENTIDVRPAVVGAFNDEFDGTVLDADWVWTNKSSGGVTAEADVKSGALRIATDLPQGGQQNRMIGKPVPAGDFDIICKVRIDGTNYDYHGLGLCAFNTANGRFLTNKLHYRYPGRPHIGWSRWNSITSSGAEGNIEVPIPVGYVRLKRVGTTLICFYAVYGNRFIEIHREDMAEWVGDFDQIALCYDVENAGGGSHMALVDWIRDYQGVSEDQIAPHIVPSAGGGGGGGSSGGGDWAFDPPLAADVTAMSGDATAPVLTDDPDIGLIIDNGPNNADGPYRGITVPIAPAGDVELTLRFNFTGQENSYTAPAFGVLGDGNTRGRALWLYKNGLMYSTVRWRQGTAGQNGGNDGDLSYGWEMLHPTWFRIKVLADNSVQWFKSSNGKTWLLMFASDGNTTGRPDQFMIGTRIASSDGRHTYLVVDRLKVV